MAMGINTNQMSLNAQRQSSSAQAALGTAMARLSSGLRINTAKDDAAGLAIGERMNTQVRGMTVAIRNANDGISMTQTAEGGLSTVVNMLQRMRELSVQAVNSTNQSGDLSAMDKEYQQLAQEIGRTLRDTQFNGVSILQATADATFQVGANSNQTITISAADLNATGGINPALGNVMVDSSGTVGTNAALNIADNTANSAQIDALDAAIQAVNEQRASLGAVQSRFDNTIANLQTSVENQTAARGRIMDADFASESAALSRAQILSQASTAMIAQANQVPQGVMKLLN
jgi:flagellin